jgi:citrate lyase subunit beta / citryl-CoA lyase
VNSVDRLRRSLLYVPGDRPEMLAKAATRGADAVILNLEDAVSPGLKEQARNAVANTLLTTDFGPKERIVRINSLDSNLGFLDLLALVPLAPDAVLLSKVSSAEHVRYAAWMIERLECIHSLPTGTVRIMCMIETAPGVLAVSEIAAAHQRVAAVLFGAADFCADVNCEPSADQRPLVYATSRLILAARSARVAAIDAPHMKPGDPEGLQQSAQMARELGFDGKAAIHPAQIPVIHSVFSPRPEDVRFARSVVDALAATTSQETTHGAVLLDGYLVEAPHLLRARRTLETARRLGMDDL